MFRNGCVGFMLLAAGLSAGAQVPKINALFPMGGRSGASVDVEIRGASLEGAEHLTIFGKGVTGNVNPGGAKPDETNKPVWQAKCGSCHELRSPANRSLSAGQWAATVDRMVKVRQAPITPQESDKITQYLQSAARSGKVTALIAVAPNTPPGLCEIRVVTARGVSTAYPFEVGALPEVTGVRGTRETAQPVTLPCTANGLIEANAERHYYKFSARKGDRLVFNLKAFRFNELIQYFFFPNLRLYNAAGTQLAENHGYYDLDPLIDWICPSDGEYTLEVRDLLGRGNPAGVYRLTMGPFPYDTALEPPAGQAGTKISALVVGKNALALKTPFEVTLPNEPGLGSAATPYGAVPVYVSAYPLVRGDSIPVGPVNVPAVFAGRILNSDKPLVFKVQGSGVYEFEPYTARIGSAGILRFTLMAPDGGAMGSTGHEHRFSAKLDSGKVYQLKVEEYGGNAGPDAVFAVEARPQRPGLECMAAPANVTLRPGISSALWINLQRRDNVDGNVTVKAENLPPGVSATTLVLPPDRNQGYLMLSAAPGAASSLSSVKITVSAAGVGGSTTLKATPYDMVYVDNQQKFFARTECIAAVCGKPDYTVQMEAPGPLRLTAGQNTEVKMRVQRFNGFKGNVTVNINGLPGGWTANQETAGDGQNEVTLLIRADGGNQDQFMKRDPKLEPLHALLEANADEYRFAVAYPEVVAGK